MSLQPKRPSWAERVDKYMQRELRVAYGLPETAAPSELAQAQRDTRQYIAAKERGRRSPSEKADNRFLPNPEEPKIQE